MRTLGLSVIAICFFASSLFAQDKQDAVKLPANKKDLHIFILMGQSNMSGVAGMLPEDKKPVPRVLKIPTKGGLKWQPAAHPLHNRIKSDRFGLGIPFAKEYLKDKPNVTVGLIPVAWGGAGISRLKKGTPTYADAIKKAQHAMKKGTIKGVLWHQGESDTVKDELANSYEGKLHQLIKDVRADLKTPKLPFIAGNLGEFYGTKKGHDTPDRIKRINQVRSVFKELPSKMPNTGYVKSTGCSAGRANVHFDRKSYIIMGKRYANVYAEVLKNPSKQ